MNEQITPDMHSSVVGGSTAGRVIQCPGSVKVNADSPRESSDAARKGTSLHNAIAAILEDRLEKDEDVIGQKYSDGEGGELVVTHGDYDKMLKPSLEYFDEVVGDDEFILEQSVRYPGIEGGYGTADVIFRNGILDWKFGGTIVPVTKNAQLMFYLWAAIHDDATGYMFDRGPGATYAIHIAQPARNRFVPDSITWGDLVDFDTRLREAIDNARSANPRFAFGPGCGFCAKRACPLLDASAEQLQRHMAGGVDNEDYTKLLDLCDHVEVYIKGVRERARKYAQTKPVKGWKVVKHTDSPEWLETDPEKLKRKIREKLKLSAKEYLKEGIVTPTQALKAYRAKQHKKTGEPANTFELPEGMAARPDKGVKLVRESAPGEPIVSLKDTLKAASDRLHALGSQKALKKSLRKAAADEVKAVRDALRD